MVHLALSIQRTGGCHQDCPSLLLALQDKEKTTERNHEPTRKSTEAETKTVEEEEKVESDRRRHGARGATEARGGLGVMTGLEEKR